MPTVLFVCMANRFRSPIAAACFRRELEISGPDGDWKVYSAGIQALSGSSAEPEAIAYVRRLGQSIQGHRSRRMDATMAEKADLILVMEQGHKDLLCRQYPGSAHKVHLLGELATGRSFDILDPSGPYGEGVECAIEQFVQMGFGGICELAAGA